MRPLVSIVIPVYNGANYLNQAIDSALSQTYKNIEVIVVNDGSNDDGATERVALSYGDKIRYFVKENGGSSSALNFGIKNMEGEWFSWLSHDDMYYPDKVKKQIEFLEGLHISGIEEINHILFSSVDYIDHRGELLSRTNICKSQNIMRQLSEKQGNEYLVAEPTKFNFYGCTCLIHKHKLEEIGLFDESLRLVNDIDMWFRLYASGVKAHFMPEVLVQARIHKDQISRSIGFSYHNPEQDMLWKRSLDWLKKYHPNNFELFFRFGRNAFMKTRYIEGNQAFEYASKLLPDKKNMLMIKKCLYILYASVRHMAKTIYVKIKM